MIGLFGIIYTVFYARLTWKEAERSAETAEKTLTHTGRPYLLPHRVTAEVRVPEEATGIKITFALTNFGSGPAMTRKYFIGAAVFDSIPRAPDYPAMWEAGVVVPPGERFQSHPKAPTFVGVDHAERLAIVDKKKVFMIWGRVEYLDISGTQHVTRFAYVYRPGPTEVADTLIPIDDPAFSENT